MIFELTARLRLARRSGAAAGSGGHRVRRAGVLVGGRRELVQGRGSTIPTSTCPPTSAAGPRYCIRRSSTFTHPPSGDRSGQRNLLPCWFSLALMCDIRIASTAASFVCAYRRTGASPRSRGDHPLRLGWLGPRRRSSCCSTAPAVERPTHALELGIVSKVVAGGAARRGESEGGESWRAKAPHYAAGMAKQLIRESLDNSLTDHLQADRPRASPTRWGPNTCVGVTAFFEARLSEVHGPMRVPARDPPRASRSRSRSERAAMMNRPTGRRSWAADRQPRRRARADHGRSRRRSDGALAYGTDLAHGRRRAARRSGSTNDLG